ncbi:hypothetical protein BCR34DRAFT_63058 [Clohesyomyces aquaticus]|uniref:Uncharacterized protein n=1 Tax=Clohesyomyces aquaticus TaxID=1231657 RepID=A0A1Y1Z247_9PLEO|nr:hypothetical protein BCR34DRAFT_63058 [Clohesyomyces aquaticus]
MAKCRLKAIPTSRHASNSGQHCHASPDALRLCRRVKSRLAGSSHMANLPRVAPLTAPSRISSYCLCFIDGCPSAHTQFSLPLLSLLIASGRPRALYIARPPWHLALPGSVKLGGVSLDRCLEGLPLCCGQLVGSKTSRRSAAFLSPPPGSALRLLHTRCETSSLKQPPTTF